MAKTLKIGWTSFDIQPLDKEDAEIRTKTVLSTTVEVEEPILDPKNYSSFNRLTRVVSWVKRFINNCRKKTTKSTYLLPKELDEAKLVISHIAQSQFVEEIDCLKNRKPVSNKSRLVSLKPFVDDNGIIRVGGRLKNANIPYNAKHQIILPNNHISQLIIQKLHIENGHGGTNQLLADTRQIYWILNGRVAVKKVIRSCIQCQKAKSKPQVPIMVDLPRCRIDSGEPPFTNTGVDFFGPLTVKHGRKRLKRWISLFTCMTIRCVHLEVVESLETDDFLNALQRFISRRQKPKLILSDCGSNFKGASKELKTELNQLNQRKIGDHCSSKEVEWRFNPPSAPHMGGAWERMVRTVKTTMRSILKTQVLTDFQLENIVNNRPLTQVSENVDDLNVLTPNHFLKGFQNVDSSISQDDSSLTHRKKWKHIQNVLNHF